MIPPFDDEGDLPPGEHAAQWSEFSNAFGYNLHRAQLIVGLEEGARILGRLGCRELLIDGSFVTAKEFPRDFDACWEIKGVNLRSLKLDHPEFFDFTNNRALQKSLYYGEFFPSAAVAEGKYPITFREFFKTTRDGKHKGIIVIDPQLIL